MSLLLLWSPSLAAKLEGDVIPLGDAVKSDDPQCQLVKVAAEDRQNARSVQISEM